MKNSIEATAARLEEWRENKDSVAAKIPIEIWADAVSLAKEVGIAKVAAGLRLGYTDLKRKVGQSLQDSPRPATFFEIKAAEMEPLGECALEVTSSSGGTVRVALKSPKPGGLAALIRNLA